LSNEGAEEDNISLLKKLFLFYISIRSEFQRQTLSNAKTLYITVGHIN